MISREKYLSLIDKHFKVHSVVALLGPRQVGKTTLARAFLEQKKHTYLTQEISYFDLEDPNDLQALENPKLTLGPLNRNLIIIDEIQRQPELFTYLRVLVDTPDFKSKILILGSASRDLIQNSSETLAGRIGFIEINPFSLDEISESRMLQLRGGYPKALLAENDDSAFLWLENYIRTFLERDIPALGFKIPAISLRRFWHMLSHYHGNMINYSELARSMAISDHSIKYYLDLLTETFMVRQLQPWHENIQKRQVKRPKIYIRDTGIFHRLLAIDNMDDLLRHPKVGASWEGFCIEQIISHYSNQTNQFYFWAIHQQAELDLLMIQGEHRTGFEIKFQDAPKVTASMHHALETLKLAQLKIIYPGNKQYQLTEQVEVLPLSAIFC